MEGEGTIHSQNMQQPKLACFLHLPTQRGTVSASAPTADVPVRVRVRGQEELVIRVVLSARSTKDLEQVLTVF